MITEQDIEELHRSHAPTEKLFDLVYTHCRIVRDIAAELIQKSDLKVNTELTLAGCLLHDIGVYRLYKNGELDEANYIQHGILGYELLKEEGLPEELCRMASHHTGVGVTKEDIQRQNLPLPLADYLAETDEELLVMYADKFHSKTEPPKFNKLETYKNSVSRFGEDKVKMFESMVERFGVPDLETLSEKYGHKLL